jgi:4a-hydroxytetrahydrobiopterin dehydratase
MGYRGKLREREAARRLRAQNLTLADIAQRLGVSKSSVSLWVRDVPFTPSKRRHGPQRRPHPAQVRRLAEIEALNEFGRTRLGQLDERAFLAAGIALYAGEGSKTDGSVRFANSDPLMMAFFCAWFRRFFDVEERRLRVSVYLHEGLDIDAAEQSWSDVTGVPRSQFTKAYRAARDSSIRRNKHPYGCAYLDYSCSRTHRTIMGLMRALLTSASYSGVAQLVAQGIVNPKVAGSSPAPGATMAALTDAEITAALAGLPQWQREGDEIVRQFELPSFPEAIEFVRRIADLAEAADHHPDLDIRYRTVRVALTTHDQGGITTRDFDLATSIEATADPS